MVQILESSNTISGTVRVAGPGAGAISLLGARSDAGVPLTATATGGAMGISRTAGTSLALLGEATSASAKTNKAVFPVPVPASYVPGNNFTVTVNAIVAGSGTLTAISTTIAVTAYTELNGVETALTVSAAQQFTKTTASTLTFTVTGSAAITNGSTLLIEVTALVTSASGANTATINGVSVTF